MRSPLVEPSDASDRTSGHPRTAIGTEHVVQLLTSPRVVVERPKHESLDGSTAELQQCVLPAKLCASIFWRAELAFVDQNRCETDLPIQPIRHVAVFLTVAGEKYEIQSGPPHGSSAFLGSARTAKCMRNERALSR